MRRALSLVGVVGVGLLGGACLPSDQEPDGSIAPPPPSCSNKRCEPTLGENNVNCPGDCPHCYAVLALGQAGAVEEALGAPDGKTVDVGEFGQLDLTIGREVRMSGGPDLELLGEVTGSAPKLEEPGCPQNLAVYTSGAVRVRVSEDGSTNWQTIGVWTQGGIKQFNLACGKLTATRWVRLESLQGASFKLDAVHALPNSCLE